MIVKTMLGPGGVARRNHELAILKRLAGVDGVVELAACDCERNQIAFLDVGGSSLASLFEQGRFDSSLALSIPRLLHIARQLASIVSRMHYAGVVHKDLNPSNIVISGDDVVQLIDFELATTNALELPSFDHESHIEGTLAYIAPEQTGRTGRSVDHRADMYALGATFYELAAGKPPFSQTDAVALIHDHIARVPANPATINPAIPAMFSAIILHLLEKEPDARYQSADGLLYDIERLRAVFGRDERASFALGERDFPLRIQPPSRLVGRSDEIASIRAQFERASNGEVQGVLISGDPGVGKTVLAAELRPLVAARSGWFVSGKFDQYRRDIASSGLNQALRSIGQLLLAEDSVTLDRQREAIRGALGVNAPLLASLVPELAILLDITPETEVDDLSQSHARAVQAATAFLGAVATSSRPLVMVIDDLQWASPTSLGLVDAILSDRNLRNVLLVGIYRKAEVDAVHPMTTLLQRWGQSERPPLDIHLSNLPAEDLGEFVAEMLRLPIEDARALAGSIVERSHGNPYDTVEFVNALRADGVLSIDETGWRWDAAAVRRHVGSGDVIELISARIERLPAATQTLIEVMGCLGNSVSLQVLAAACAIPPEAVRESLDPAFEDGLIMALDDRAMLLFRHDRVQQAAYRRVTDRGGDIQLQIARRLVSHEEGKLIAAERYLGVFASITDADERLRVAQLFDEISAGVRALNIPLAEQYLSAATQLLDGLDDDGGLRVSIIKTRHLLLVCVGRFDEADLLYEELVPLLDSVVSLLEAAAIQVTSLTKRGRVPEAVEFGIGMLHHVGIEKPDDYGPVFGKGIASLYGWLNSNTDEGELARPLITDPTVIATAQLLTRLQPAAFFCDPPAALWLMFESFNLWVERGPCVCLVSNLGAVALLTVGLAGDYDAGYAATKRIMYVGEHHCTRAEFLHATFTFELFSRHWAEPLEHSITIGRLIREHTLQVNDLQMAGFTYNLVIPTLIECVSPLDIAEAEIQSGIEFARQSGDGEIGSILPEYVQLLKALRGQTSPIGSFDGEEFNADEHAVVLGPNAMRQCMFSCYRSMVAAIFDDLVTMGRQTAVAMESGAQVGAMYANAQAHFLRGLYLSWSIPTASDEQREASLQELAKLEEWLSARAEGAPANYLHLAWFVEAEHAWAIRDFEQAARLFDTAIAAAKEQQRPWHMALLLERTGVFYLSNGIEYTGRQFLSESYVCWHSWGASGKVAHLLEQYPFLQTVARSTFAGSQHSISKTMTGISTESMDLISVLRASQALSSETNLERLRSRLVDIVSEMSGATAVQLLLWNDDTRQWLLPAPDNSETQLSAEEAAARGLLPLGAFRYAERTGSPLLVSDALRDDRFSGDAFFTVRERCSLLVVPITSKGAPRAMLVVYNDLSSDVFTPDRVDAVTLIAGQLAVSLDNALAERFRSLVQRSSDVTMVVDSRDTLSYVSTASMAMLGVSNTELIGSRLLELFHEDDQLAVSRQLSLANRESSEVLVCRVIDAQKQILHVELTFTDLSSDPAIGGVVVHMRDISERFRLEQELNRSQKMESIGQLAAGIAHEINTPIQFVGDNTRFVADALTDLLALLDRYREAYKADDVSAAIADVERFAAEIEADYLASEAPPALVQSLDGISRVAIIVQAMKIFGHPSGDSFAPADINDAVRNTLVIAHSRIADVADVVTELDELPLVSCNLSEVNQALLNIVVNAAQAIGSSVQSSGGRGRLSVRTHHNDVDVFIAVTDTGGGMPPEVQERVFDPFFTTKEVGAGTGQGLSITYSLIHDHHGGSISVESESGETTFTIRLPIAGKPSSGSTSG